MTKTKYYDLQMDDPQDDYDVEVVNANLKKIDEQMKTRENATDALQEPEFTVADKRENIASKEKMPKILGKIAKFFADLKKVAFTGNYKDLTDKPGAATQTADGMLSATDKKAIDLLGAPIGSCATGQATAAKVATLKNFKLAVGLSIAVKFTDTAGTANPASGNLTLNVNGTGAKTIGYFRNGNKAALTYASGTFFCNNATHIFTYDGAYWLCMDWNADNNTVYSNMTAATASAAGKAGLVPAPAAGKQAQYLRGDGTWSTPPNTTYTSATTTANGLMSATDKAALENLKKNVSYANKKFYVNAASGSDSNNGLSSTTAFKTINKALSMIPYGKNITSEVRVASGTYDEILILSQKNVVFHPTGAEESITVAGIFAYSSCRAIFDGINITINRKEGTDGIRAYDGAVMDFYNNITINGNDTTYTGIITSNNSIVTVRKNLVIKKGICGIGAYKASNIVCEAAIDIEDCEYAVVANGASNISILGSLTFLNITGYALNTNGGVIRVPEVRGTSVTWNGGRIYAGSQSNIGYY